MEIALWIVSGLLTLVYLFAGSLKIATARDKLLSQLPWVEDFSPVQVKLIGAVEVLGAVGLILPRLLDIVPMLATVAAAGLVLVQAAAIAVHVRRGETTQLPVNAVLLVLAGFVATAGLLGY